MFSYHKIVFGIKHRYQISDVLKIFKQQRSCSILISEHNALDVDKCCDRPDVHYHGMVEFNDGESKIGIFLTYLSPYCLYINTDHCSNPVEYMTYITLAPKRIIAQEILNSSKLLEYLETASRMKSDVMEKKTERKLSLINRNNNILKIVDFLLKFGYYGNNVLSKYKKDEPCLAWFQKWVDENIEVVQSISHRSIETAMSISQKIILNSSILVLSNRFELQDGYLLPEESAKFVLDWCSYQKLDPKAFIKNLIRCLDKRGGNRNSIYLQGSANSGKTYIIQSIIDACFHVGQVTVESSAYSFVWEKCADKRLIVLREPHFSMINFDQLDKILSGSGTLIYKHNDVVDYLPPTPVIILANEQDWIDDPQLSEKIKRRFLCCYSDLKNFPIMPKKKLHPRWLNLLKNSADVDQFDDKTASTHLQKISRDDLLTTEKTRNTNQISGSENTMQPDTKYRKRPKSGIEHDGGRNKMESGGSERYKGQIPKKVLKTRCNQTPNIGSIGHDGE
ncbi:unnamed protein product [Larinioides sclopetarius]|uniref:Parvovirus non-structural protein 1 helicase domain-containing protein n=1 Tax=Larinioides sclopetarius TaxID=280406 RepID=A0AAV1ZJ77_9ARAC